MFDKDRYYFKSVIEGKKWIEPDRYAVPMFMEFYRNLGLAYK